jgi:putative SOS response-associated peptidase YedK
MCGRYELNETPARLGSRYRVEPGDLELAQNADLRPTDTNPVILLREGQRVASMRRWGIVPFWAKDPKAISTPFNARSEEAHAKPMFRGPFKSRRCVVSATAFFEWKAIEGQKKKQKHCIARADGDLVTLAGLYDYWRRGDEAIESFTILTTAPNTLMKTIHNRMPVILGQGDEDEWLDPRLASTLRGRCACRARANGWKSRSRCSTKRLRQSGSSMPKALIKVMQRTSVKSPVEMAEAPRDTVTRSIS